MPRLGKPELYDRIINALQRQGAKVVIRSAPNDHPLQISVIEDEESISKVRIYIWNITHGGNHRAADEYRIQATGNFNRFERLAGEKTLILGYWDELKMFAGFDYSFHDQPFGASPSFQIREEHFVRANQFGFSTCEKGNEELAIAFRSDFLLTYILNCESLHRLGQATPRELTAIKSIAEDDFQVNDINLSEIQTQERKNVVVSVSKKMRSARFRDRVMTAYSNRCAFSGIQLNLVEAAHILPVSESESTDDVFNGIALSALYHTAFDRGLVTIDHEYRIKINEAKIRNYRAIDLAGGEEKFRAALQPIMNLPPSIRDRPHPDLIRKANTLRGWSQAA